MKLIVDNLYKNYGKKEVLKGIDFQFESGKIYGLLGVNGSGKTTFFNCLNEDTPINSGNLYIEINNEKRKLITNDISYVLALPNMPEFLTGREFLQFFIDINKNKFNQLKEPDYYFDLLKIDEKDRDNLIKDYSLGMKNKIQIIVNIIANTQILLLDEPLTSFDVVVAEEMKQLLKSIKKEHIIIFSTHILDLATSLCDEIVILNNGTLQLMDKNNLNDEKFKEKIINIFKESN